MSSGARAGLVSADVLQREKQELRKHERSTRHLEGGSVEHGPAPAPLLLLCPGSWTCCWEPWPGSLLHLGVSEQCQGGHRGGEMLFLCTAEGAGG